MTAPRPLAPLTLLFAGLAICAALLLVPWIVRAQRSQAVTSTEDVTGTNPPAKPTNLQAPAEHDSVTLTRTALMDQTVTHYAIRRRSRDTDAPVVFHVIASNAGPETSDSDRSVSASSTYNYRVTAVSPTGTGQWSGFVNVDTPAAPDPTPTPSPTPESEPEPQTDPAFLAPSSLAAGIVYEGDSLSWTAPAEDAGSVTGYELLRAVGEGEMATLAADSASTTTSDTDATPNEAGETYAYQVKVIRDEDRRQASGQTQVQVPDDTVDLAPFSLNAALGAPRAASDIRNRRPVGNCRRLRWRSREAVPPRARVT